MTPRELERLAKLGLGPESVVHSLDFCGSTRVAGEPSPAPRPPPPPAEGGERYEIGEEVARGGFGVVHRGRDRRLDRPVAVKRVRGVATEETWRRFETEARIAAALDHPGIVRVLDVDRDAGGIFLILEWVEGSDFQRVLRTGTLPPGEVARLGASLARALDYAHGRGVLHLDVAPGNVIRTGPESVKVVDFGLAAALSRAGARGPVGTPGFIAPEVLAGHPPDARADVYGAGMTLAALLLGPTPSREGLANMPAPVARTLWAATADDPDRRLASAADLAVCLERPGSAPTAAPERACSACGSRIAAGHRHCALCGTDGGPACAGCGYDGPIEGHFCPACGAHRTRFSILRRFLVEQRRRVFRPE